MKSCFIISPIGDEGSEIRERADRLYKFILKPVCEKCGFEVLRADKINTSDSITDTIIDNLKKAELVIADITGHNPNVFYEMGYRACLNKPLIHLKMKDEKIPFDISTIRTFDYDFEIETVEELKERLVQTISSFSIVPNDDEISGGEVIDNTNEGIATILQILYGIQDIIGELRQEIKNKDSEAIQAVMKTSLDNASANVESADTTMMKILLPELLKNPETIKNLMELSKFTEEK